MMLRDCTTVVAADEEHRVYKAEKDDAITEFCVHAG